MKFVCKEEKSLLDQLQEFFPDSSKRTLRTWIEHDRVEVNGRAISYPKTVIKVNDRIEVRPRKESAGGIEILYEDNDLVVINKPVGLLSVATDYEKGRTAHTFLKDRSPVRKVWVIHRLDRETSGVMIFAYTEKAYEGLKADLKERRVKREYTAIVEGEFEEPTGTFQSYLIEDDNYVVHTTNDEERGQIAITHFDVVESTPQFTRLDIRLETGRKNQIRVHCQEAGHPIVGDTKYGAIENPLKRLCLHARKLSFRHPVKGTMMTFEAPVPYEFARLTAPQRRRY